ncbi:tetratricopeptide repeat protein [Umezawaea beigongshangensis]|uniref:tetratricopeptide repeat protein n=1 Tax=Umezawaea beigongshangensis TaxID=2780383 RepID=UPI0018F22240|nr:tetratricopeptide repeat protein [Umezawaea beigongshangensis]
MAEAIVAALVRAAELTASGRPREAVDLLRPVLAAHPLHTEAWCRLAAAQLDAGDADAALTAAKQALVLGGDRAWAQRLAALALSELDRHREAAVAAREAVRHGPDDWRGLVVLAEVLQVDPDGRAEALEAAREAARLAPGQARAFQVLGDVAVRRGDPGAAEHAYRTALELDPSDADVRADLAALLRARDRDRTGSAAPAATPAPPPEAVATARALLRTALVRVAALLAAGDGLLLIAALPRPTPQLAWLSGLLLAACAVVVLRLRRPAVRDVVARLLRRPGRLPVVASALAASALLLAGWTAALALGATTTQPLVLAWLCALAAGGVLVLAGDVRR